MSHRTYLMSPVTFVRAPPLWVFLSSEIRANQMIGPNFAFELCALKFPREVCCWISELLFFFLFSLELF